MEIVQLASWQLNAMIRTEKKKKIITNKTSIKGRPHYYSTKKEEYAHIKFDLDAGTRTMISDKQQQYGKYPTNRRQLDLSPLFNWNTKQLFVYVIASYSSLDDDRAKTSAPQTSQSIIWDTVIQAPESPYSFDALRERFLSSPSLSRRSTTKRKGGRSSSTKKKDALRPGLVHLTNQRPKYQIGDITGRLAERRNVTLSVGWNVQPWVGALWWSPASGSAPHTAGLVEASKAFDFPALKDGSSSKAGANSGGNTGRGR